MTKRRRDPFRLPDPKPTDSFVEIIAQALVMLIALPCVYLIAVYIVLPFSQWMMIPRR